MQIVRFDARCPGGARLLRKAARLAGFDGRLEVRKGPHIEAAGFRTLGEFRPPSTIRIWVEADIDNLGTYLHELGHAWRYRRGKYEPCDNWRLRVEYSTDPEERAANRFARKIRSLL